MSNLSQKLREGRDFLLQRGCQSASLDAKLLMSYVTKLSLVELFIRSDESISVEQSIFFRKLLERRATGYPMAYILGVKEFWGLQLKVSPAVLIPRPDTEILVEQALLCNFSCVLDLGTGSGAVILALKHERPDCNAYAGDISAQALEIAKENAKSLHLDVEFKKSSWFENFSSQSFDLIVSNPPYIRDNDEHLTQTSLPFEPRGALTSGIDGLDDIRKIIGESRFHLNVGGHLMIEHGYDQGSIVRDLFKKSGFVDVKTVRDLGKNERVTLGTMAN